MQATTLDLTADIIDVRDIIARVEELADTLTTYTAEASQHPELADEHRSLCALMESLKGLGGDEQWRGDWYPLTLIRDSHFRDYAIELAYDAGLIQFDVTWPHSCIDWTQAARELRHDYTGVDIDGVTYWTR